MTGTVTPDSLVEAVAAFLRTRLLPEATDDLAYEIRVCANALDLAVRAIRQPAEAQAAHQQRLERLLGRPGPREALDLLLGEWIREGRIGPDHPELVGHLRQAAIDSLKVDQPRYSALVRSLEE